MIPDHSHRRLGRTGLYVHPLALGTMTFGQHASWGTDEAVSRAVLDRFLDAGGNLVDTANVYAGGRSEELLGRFLAAAGRRDRVVLATKYAGPNGDPDPNTRSNGRRNMIASVEASLRRLRTDHVDLLWLHLWDTTTPVDEVVAAFDELVRAGKIRAAGLSNVPAWYATRAHLTARFHGREPVAALQLKYSLLDRTIEHEHVPAARDTGAGIVAYGPLASGLLTGRYDAPPDGTPTPRSGGGRLTHPGFAAGALDRTPGAGARRHAMVTALRAVAAETGHRPAQIALAWLLDRPGVTAVLLGASGPDQLDENLGAAGVRLAAEQADRLERAGRPPRPYPHDLYDEGFRREMADLAERMTS